MFDPVASKLRQHMRQIERVNRRLALADIPGKVIAGSQDMGSRTLRLDLGLSADGRVIKSPKTGWQEPGAGTLKLHSKPADGEQMRLRSPSGTVGTASLADWSTYDDDNAPPSQSGDEAILEYGGKARIRLTEEMVELSIGGSTITLTADTIKALSAEIAVDGRLAIAGDSITHNETDVGSTHVHGGVQRGDSETNPPS